MSSSAPKTERSCPLGHTCDACHWQVKVSRENVTTGEVTTYDSCAMVQLPQLLELNWRQMDQFGAELSAFRGDVHTGNQQMGQILLTAMKPRLNGRE